jgi:hypothetical protein
MNRPLPFCGLLLLVAGCGVTPTSESDQPLIIVHGCAAEDAFPVGGKEVTKSTANPWGSRTGVVVASDPDSSGLMVIYGVDMTSSGPDGIVWYMLAGTNNDLYNFEAYPQSERYCGKILGNGSAGSSPQEPPDPTFNGICVPNSIYSTAQSWYLYGPPDLGNAYLCRSYSSGGCVPKTCAQVSSCGYQPDGCFNSYISCPCGCPCGSVGGKCLICLPL